MARLEIGEVLLTTRMSDIFQGLGHAILTRDAALGQRDTEGEVIQNGHLRRQGEGKPAIGVVPAGELDLHVALALAGTQRQGVQGVLIQIKSDAHFPNVAGRSRAGKLRRGEFKPSFKGMTYNTVKPAHPTRESDWVEELRASWIPAPAIAGKSGRF